MRRLVLLLALAGALAAPSLADASPSVRYGVMDDAWIAYGPGTLQERLDRLDALGTDVVRFTLRWDQVEAARGTYRWGVAEDVLVGLREHGIGAVVTIYGTPKWANARRGASWAPTSAASIASFAAAAQRHFPWVTRWLIWNEPNQRIWLRPTSPTVYVQKLLNPAYAALHRANRRARVGGGVTAPRGSIGGVSPIDWIRGMRAAHARLDAYAHNPYPLNPRSETPTTGGCGRCSTLTMATLDRLLLEVKKAFGSKRIWLTEYGYQTNPPDRMLGVSRAQQARYLADGALRAYRAPRVDMLIHFLIRDELIVGRWQSGLFDVKGAAKPSMLAFSFPLAEVSRSGTRVVLWGQIRPRSGPQAYRLQRFSSGRWVWVGGTKPTSLRGFYQRVVTASRGTRFRIWSPADEAPSPAVVVR
jgi:hypothetical protein